jgi:hypothetical protein
LQLFAFLFEEIKIEIQVNRLLSVVLYICIEWNVISDMKEECKFGTYEIKMFRA